MDDDFDNELNHVMVESETPSKAAKTTSLATPATSRRKLPWQMEHSATKPSSALQTPNTERRLLNDPFASRQPAQKGLLFTPTGLNGGENHQAATPSPTYETPTPMRLKNADPDTLVQDVLILLQEANVYLSTTTQSDLRGLLSKHAKNAEGYKRGRDVLRTTVKARDAKITELNYRVATLEAELDAEKAMMTHLQWEAQEEASDT